LLQEIASVLNVYEGDISYNDYIKTLTILEEQGVINTTHNDRGTIIKSVRLADKWQPLALH
jgi:hypothetical protein